MTRLLDGLGSTISGGSLTRRRLLHGVGIGAVALTTRGVAVAGGDTSLGTSRLLHQATPDVEQVDELVIDLGVETPSLDPALVYDNDGWSVIHSIYDSLVQYGPTGELEMLLAESISQPDPVTFEIKLRPNLTFHNGEPVDAKAIVFSVQHLVADETASQLADTFKVIAEAREVDPLTVQFDLLQPAPWLPAQMAAWLALIPPAYGASNDIGANPVGAGPYRFVAWERGDHITLEANPDYPAGSLKGQPIAKRVVVRFVPEASTRVADLLAGNAGLIRTIPDQLRAVEDGGAQAIATPISGVTFVRIATDTEPFGDARVRQALNYAVDVNAIVEALIGGNGKRLANLFPESGLGYNPDLAPYAYDPDRAKALLAEAGLGEGFSTALEHTVGENQTIVEAIAAQLGDVGIEVELQPRETAIFNETWADTAAAPLRYASWRPMFDPYTLINLMVSNQGFLSRYDSAAAQTLIDAGAVEANPATRAEIYRQLGQALHDEPAAIYLFSLTAFYGASAELPAWSPRPDDYVIPTVRND
ncbi:MAG: ABC transporter substrate-binding protein [Thermomicrobiales bacterium]